MSHYRSNREVEIYRAARNKLRHVYYAHLRATGQPPSQASGIFAKVSELQPLPPKVEAAFEHAVKCAQRAYAWELDA